MELTGREYSNFRVLCFNSFNIFYLQELIFKLNESKFHCPCGVGFQFEDDMQVHQVNHHLYTSHDLDGGMA